MSKIPWPLVYFLGVIPITLQLFFAIPSPLQGNDFFNFSLCATYFILGYFIFADEGVIKKLEKYRLLSLGIFMIVFVLAHYGPALFRNALFHVLGWFASLAFLGLARRYLNSSNSKILRYLLESSFAVYLFHNTYIAVSFWFLAKLIDNLFLLISLTWFSTYALTFLTYEILKRFRVTRFMFALKR